MVRSRRNWDSRCGAFAILMVLAGLLMPPAPACAQCRTRQDHNPKLLFHFPPTSPDRPCAGPGRRPGCNVRLQGAIGQDQFVYVLAARADIDAGIGAVSFSFWSLFGLEILDWGSCADGSLVLNRDNPNPINVIYNFWWNTEANCQRTPMPGDLTECQAVVAWFRVRADRYAPLEFYSGNSYIIDCQGRSTQLRYYDLARAEIGTGKAWNPCYCNYEGCGFPVDGPRVCAAGDTLFYDGRFAWSEPCTVWWTISGPGRIIENGDTVIRVVAEGPGTIELKYWFHCPDSDGCTSFTVTVNDDVPVLPTTWSRIKLLTHEP